MLWTTTSRQFSLIRVESMGSIISRTSQLDPDVPISVHPALDVTGSCGDIGGIPDGLLCSSWFSNSGDFHQHGVDGLYLQESSLFHKFHTNGFAVLGL